MPGRTPKGQRSRNRDEYRVPPLPADLDDLLKAELIQLGAARGIDVDPAATKREIINLLRGGV